MAIPSKPFTKVTGSLIKDSSIQSVDIGENQIGIRELNVLGTPEVGDAIVVNAQGELEYSPVAGSSTTLGSLADVDLSGLQIGDTIVYDGTNWVPGAASGVPGPAGADGASAYEIAVAEGFVGDEAAWLASLVGPQGPGGVDGINGTNGADGASAYEVAVAEGFVGDEAAWLASLVGPQGPQGIQGETGPAGPQGEAGTGINIIGSLNDPSELPVTGNPGEAYLINGDLWVWDGTAWVNAGNIQGPVGETGPQGPAGADGADGTPGASAYEVAVAEGFVGDEAAWLASLVGPEGPQGIPGESGPQGIQGETGPAGADGASAYEIAVAEGFVGDEAAWLASLVGPQGPQGEQGIQGEIGPAGATGDTGPAGADGAPGASAYEVAVAEGFVGDEAAWLASLVGPQGPQGEPGPAGADGEITVAANIGTGEGVYATKVGNELQFKSLEAGTNITITSDADSITISASGGDATGSVANVPDTLMLRSPTGSVEIGTVNFTDSTDGAVTWNDEDGTLDVTLKGSNVTLQVGQEEILRIYNDTGSALTDGQVVYLSGAQASGQRPTVALASATAANTSTKSVGFVTEPIADESEGYIVVRGLVRGVNTAAYAPGTFLWLGSTPGTFTDTAPAAPAHSVALGVVVRQHATSGSIYVSVQNGYELEELHNVLITSLNTNDYLRFNGTVWENKEIDYTDIANTPDIPATLDDLTDVSTAGATTNQVLTYNGTSWVAATPTGGGSGNLPIGGTEGQLLAKNSSTDFDASWVDAPLFKQAALRFETSNSPAGIQGYTSGAPGTWTVIVGPPGTNTQVTLQFATPTFITSMFFQGTDLTNNRFVLRPLVATINPFTNAAQTEYTLTLSLANVGVSGTGAGHFFMLLNYWEL